jgi:hypothetical protein
MLQRAGPLAVAGLDAKPRDLRLNQTGGESQTKPFLSYVTSYTPGLPNARFDRATDERKSPDPYRGRHATESSRISKYNWHELKRGYCKRNAGERAEIQGRGMAAEKERSRKIEDYKMFGKIKREVNCEPSEDKAIIEQSVEFIYQ